MSVDICGRGFFKRNPALDLERPQGCSLGGERKHKADTSRSGRDLRELRANQAADSERHATPRSSAWFETVSDYQSPRCCLSSSVVILQIASLGANCKAPIRRAGILELQKIHRASAFFAFGRPANQKRTMLGRAATEVIGESER